MKSHILQKEKKTFMGIFVKIKLSPVQETLNVNVYFVARRLQLKPLQMFTLQIVRFFYFK